MLPSSPPTKHRKAHYCLAKCLQWAYDNGYALDTEPWQSSMSALRRLDPDEFARLKINPNGGSNAPEES